MSFWQLTEMDLRVSAIYPILVGILIIAFGTGATILDIFIGAINIIQGIRIGLGDYERAY